MRRRRKTDCGTGYGFKSASLQRKTTARPLNVNSATALDDDDPWNAIAAPPPTTRANPLVAGRGRATALDDDDPWAAIAAPPRTTRANPLVAGRGRGKPAAPKLGAQRITGRPHPGCNSGTENSEKQG
ncbi:hypothetical protein POTOM_052990 [Populus tomentosa]|uniref:Uncharacterized protein n=1 Tax=Populus tomentosa TaxID=118781 RepID=A0A8X8C6E3_POPTO|nr:hypothetical protein POTOM_052990 [Populus tomentosa]